MPLSDPAPRTLLHRRDIQLRGYHRDDGLFDIEAHLLDTKADAFEHDTHGTVPGGTPLHGMWVRLTIDEEMVVVRAEAASDHTPYAICPSAAPNFTRLAGLKIGPGFNRAVAERVGGTAGCTHLREVLGQMATVAYQTLYPFRAVKERAEAARRVAAGEPPPRQRPGLVGSCIAYAPDSPVTLKRWPWLKDAAAE
jgi:Protein of unknown function (DUF2889)